MDNFRNNRFRKIKFYRVEGCFSFIKDPIVAVLTTAENYRNKLLLWKTHNDVLQNKMVLLPSFRHVITSAWIYHLNCSPGCFQQILKVTPCKIEAIRPLASHPANHPRRTRHAGHCWRNKYLLVWTPTHGHTSTSWTVKTYCMLWVNYRLNWAKMKITQTYHFISYMKITWKYNEILKI